MNTISLLLLFYTAVIVPVQILIWKYDDPCVMFPTLYFDLLVDLFFMVSPRLTGACHMLRPNLLRSLVFCY